MTRPKDLPPAEAYEHGTRARYVAGCRCKPCTKSNVDLYHEKQRRAKEAVLGLEVLPPVPIIRTRKMPDGTTKSRTYRNGCPGVQGEPCEARSFLRKDSTGGVCGKCRVKLVWNGLVPSDRARVHILLLSEKGVGRDAIRDVSGVAVSVIAEISQGRKKQIRLETERLILSVGETDHADGALVDAKPVWKKIRILMKKHGYTKMRISKITGHNGKSLQLGRTQVTAANARQIEALLELAESDYSHDLKVEEICTQCGMSHAPANRQRLITRMYLEGLPSDQIKKAWPCFYSFDYTDEAAERRFYRDIEAIKTSTKKNLKAC